ncbi:MAG: PhoH family protein, partial [Shewanella sp.]
MSSKLTTMNLYLEPAETRRLASLCGPFDDNIKQIERRVGVEIVRKNNHFQITGLPRNCLSANNLLKQLYIETQTVKGSTPDLEPEQVHIAIQEAIALEQDDSGDDKALH